MADNKVQRFKPVTNLVGGRTQTQILEFLKKAPRTKKSPVGSSNLDYVPIYEIEDKLDNLFGKFGWFWQVKNIETSLNSVIVFGAIWVRGSDGSFTEYMSGVGAAPLQFDDYWKRDAKGRIMVGSDKKPMKVRDLKYDAQAMKTNAFQLAAPSASSFALSNAAARIGKPFGRNLNGRDFPETIEVPAAVDEVANAKIDAINNLFGKE